MMSDERTEGPHHLRLTLRTLLAWLDDTLAPVEARHIGQRVAETPFAKELVERIHKVSRRRRLTVPNSTGPDATDPNIVAGYLDNELPPDQISELEERCLKSDVHLAEVASCHQILSLIGQKARVPAEARSRMYRLVKGQETSRRPPTLQATPDLTDSAAAPIPAWSMPESPRSPAWQRFAPAVAVVGLMAAMIWSAWNLTPRNQQEEQAEAQSATKVERGKAAGVAEPEDGVAVDLARATQPGTIEDSAKVPEEESPEVALAGANEAATATETSVQPDEATMAGGTLAPGVAGMVGPSQGILLRWDPDARTWGTLEPGTTLLPDDRIVALAPFRMSVTVGGADVDLIGPGEIQVGSPQAGETARLALAKGRIVLRPHRAESAAAVTVLIEGHPIKLVLSNDGPVGLTRFDHREPGASEPTTPTLSIHAAAGRVAVEAGGTAETLVAPGSIEFTPPGTFSTAEAAAPPSWVTAKSASEVDQVTGQAFAKFFKPESSTTRALLEAIEDENAPIRVLAVSALGAIGNIDLVVPAMNRADEPNTRRAAIAVLREIAARNPESARAVNDQLILFGGEDWERTVSKLLTGYTAEEAKKEETYAQLVRLLENQDVGIRTLAIEQLMKLKNRDPLEYDPDDPDGAGLKAWQELLRNGEFRPAPAASPAESP